jgi:hypothetical protein
MLQPEIIEMFARFWSSQTVSNSVEYFYQRVTVELSQNFTNIHAHDISSYCNDHISFF